MRLVLVGKMRTGKDTVAEYLVKKYGFRQYAFGTGIKEVSKILFPEEVAKGKPRALYQTLGQLMRQINSTVWIDYTFRQIEGDSPQNAIISDLRQMNEFEAAKERDYVVIKIVTESSTQINRIIERNDNFNIHDLTHSTELETEKIPYDFLIENNGSLEELYENIEQILTNIDRR